MNIRISDIPAKIPVRPAKVRLKFRKFWWRKLTQGHGIENGRTNTWRFCPCCAPGARARFGAFLAAAAAASGSAAISAAFSACPNHTLPS